MLSAHSIPMNDVAPELAKKLPRYPSVPVVLIGWMGRDLAFRGAGVGSLLLYDAISRVSKAPIPHCQEWPKGGPSEVDPERCGSGLLLIDRQGAAK